MPAVFLRHRQPDLPEYMDDPACDLDMLRRTYAQFKYVNGAISGWRRIYRRWIRPRLSGNPSRLLDIGCGGGDLVERLARWTARDGLNVEITAADPDERAIDFLKSRSFPDSVIIRQAMTMDLIREGQEYDVVISNHVIHHLNKTELQQFLGDSTALATRLALHNDIRRDDFAYLGFMPTALMFRRSFITVDGLMSIRRSYLPGELRRVVPEPWIVRPMPLFRNLLLWQP